MAAQACRRTTRQGGSVTGISTETTRAATGTKSQNAKSDAVAKPASRKLFRLVTDICLFALPAGIHDLDPLALTLERIMGARVAVTVYDGRWTRDGERVVWKDESQGNVPDNSNQEPSDEDDSDDSQDPD